MRPGLTTAVRWPLTLLALVVVGSGVAACGDSDLHEHAVPDLDLGDAATREAADAVRRAERLLDADAAEDAEPLLRRALELRPGDATVAVLLARVLVERGRYADAVPLLRPLVDDAAVSQQAHELLTKCLHVGGDLPAARQAYEAWIATRDRNYEQLFGYGQVLYALGEHEAAVKALQAAERHGPGRADARTDLGLALQALGRLPEAEAKQRDAIERDPNRAECWFRLGDVISRQDVARRGEAIDAMRRAVELEPRHVHAQLYLYRLLRLAVADGHQDLAPEAARRWRVVLRLHGRVQAGGRAGAGQRPPADADEVERRLRERLDENPDDVRAGRELAGLLHALGYADEAVPYYDRLLAAGTGEAPLLAAAGCAHLLAGDASRAAELLAAAVAAGDASPATARHHAWALLVLDRADEAEALLAARLAADPDDRLARLAHGLARMRTGALDQGLQEIQAAGWLE